MRNGTLEIVDQSGTVLVRRDVHAAEETLDVSALAKGTYFIKIRVTGERDFAQRLIKE